MLHILWVILKVLLVILAIILGIVLALLALLLFCPIRYGVIGYKQEESLYGQARVSWLLHAVSVNLRYQDKTSSLQVKILGIPLESYQRLIVRFHKKPEGIEEKKSKRLKRASKKKEQKAIEQNTIEQNSTEEKPLEQKIAETEAFSQTAEAAEEAIPELSDSGDAKTLDTRNSVFSAIWNAIKGLWNGIASLVKGIFSKFMGILRFIYHIPAKIWNFFGKIALTYQRLCVNIEKWKSFLEDERTKAAFSLGWQELVKLLRHIGPTKIQGKLTFGFEDPSLTGQALAVISATIPIHKNRVTIEPIFDEKILEADIRMKGRIYLFIVLRSAVKLYFDKNIKFMMKAMRKED